MDLDTFRTTLPGARTLTLILILLSLLSMGTSFLAGWEIARSADRDVRPSQPVRAAPAPTPPPAVLAPGTPCDGQRLTGTLDEQDAGEDPSVAPPWHFTVNICLGAPRGASL